MNYFKKILLFALPYKRFAFLNIFFNALYALFSALSFVALIPMLNVLFEKTPTVDKEPIYTGFSPTDALMKRFITVAMCHVFLIILGIIGIFIRKNYGPIKLLKGPESPKKESKQTVLKTPESK